MTHAGGKHHCYYRSGTEYLKEKSVTGRWWFHTDAIPQSDGSKHHLSLHKQHCGWAEAVVDGGGHRNDSRFLFLEDHIASLQKTLAFP